MVECKKGVVKAGDLGSDDVLMFFITKNEVDLCAPYRIHMQIEELKKMGTNGKHKIELSFMGYDNDSKELDQIPEICSYLGALFKTVPELFYFINIKSYTFSLLMDIIFTNPQARILANRALIDYAESIGDTSTMIMDSFWLHYIMTKSGRIELKNEPKKKLITKDGLILFLL